MQVHERPQAAPVLVLRGIKNTGIFLRATVRPVLRVDGCKSGSVPG